MPHDASRPARLPQSAVPRTYAWLAPAYDGFAQLVAGRARDLALRWAAVRNGERVLEVAVGTGLSFATLLQQNPTGWTEGIDRAPAMLRRARRRAAHAPTARYRLRLGDARALDYPDDAFDLLVSSYLLDLLPADDMMTALQGFRRVLRPGGRLVLAHMTDGQRRVHRAWEGLYRLWPPLLGGCRGIQAVPALRRTGFVRVRRQYVHEWGFPSEVACGYVPE